MNISLSLIEGLEEDIDDMKDYLPYFLKEWKQLYPDQVKTHVNAIAYSKEVSKMEAIGILENDISEQFTDLITMYKKFPNPFKIYSYCVISSDHTNLDIKNLYETLEIDGKLPLIWVWSEHTQYPFDFELKDAYLVTGLVHKKDIDWNMTLLKNCELSCGLNEREIIIVPEIKVQIIKINRTYMI